MFKAAGWKPNPDNVPHTGWRLPRNGTTQQFEPNREWKRVAPTGEARAVKKKVKERAAQIGERMAEEMRGT
ncbi:hypothetical protein FRB94_013240 [Tulasnella sp. JGI-2019a]|nr:hypothetical protein FRB94_013240 [Tulasnella sp. JGI-2019a]